MTATLPYLVTQGLTGVPLLIAASLQPLPALDPAERLEDKRPMHFLKTLFWVILALIAVIFSLRNWEAVPINLWAGLTADVKLPALLLLSALIGFLPTYAVHRTKLWRLKRRIDNLERNALMAGTPAPSPEPVDPQPGALS